MNRQQIKNRARGLPLKYRIIVLKALNNHGERTAITQLNRAWKFCNGNEGGEESRKGIMLNVSSIPKIEQKALEDDSSSRRCIGLSNTQTEGVVTGSNPAVPSHPFTSDGEKKTEQGNSVRVEELTRNGYSVGKIAKELCLTRRSVLAIRARLHKKLTNVPVCTTHTTTGGQPPPERSQPQVHRFEVEVGLPWERGTNNSWRDGIKKNQVNNYQENKEFKGGRIEDFDLNENVSVRATPFRLFLYVTGAWGKSIEECKERAWLLAQEAALKLQEIYGFNFDLTIPLRFKGAEWALVNHETAKKAVKAGLQFLTIINGQKRMWTDKTPGKSLEFVREEDAKISYKDEEARVFAGLTNEKIAHHLNELILTVNNIVRLQEVQIRQMMPENIDENKKAIERPDYFG